MIDVETISDEEFGANEYLIKKCNLCDFSTEIEKDFEFHLLQHQEPTFKCQHEGCSKVFYHTRAFKRHQEVHQVERSFVCSSPTCRKTFKTKYALNTHYVSHRVLKIYRCTICEKPFRDNNARVAHMKVHGPRPMKTFEEIMAEKLVIPSDLTPEVSDLAFRDPFWFKNMTFEQILALTPNNVTKCSICNKIFSRKQSLRHHMQSVHLNPKIFKCDLCNKILMEKRTLASHIAIYHKI